MHARVPDIFDTGTKIKTEMLNLIASARDYILIDSFLLSADGEASDVLEALKRKHLAGVRVHVIADSSSLYLPGGKEAFQFFREAGMPVAEYNPLRFYKLVVAPALLPRDHRKFWIVDGKKLFIGGANIFPTSLQSSDKNGNRDLMVLVESAEAIERMIESFVLTWNRCSRKDLNPADFRIRARKNGTAQLWLSDQNQLARYPNKVEKTFDSICARAQNEIWLIQPYTFTSPDLLRHFRRLSRRGVTVNVMLSSVVQSPRFHYASHYGIKDILQTGAKVWIYKEEYGPLHAKAAVVDRRWASIGSANLNFRSFHLSKEANVAFSDPESVAKILAILDELKAKCRPVDLQEAENYRSTEYGFTWLWMQIAG